MIPPLLSSALISGASNLLGGFLASKGQKDANRANARLAQKQMDFQERMSSTAYQRSAKDLDAAGLNRILALGSSASTPSGAKPEIRNEKAGIAEGASRAVNSALTARAQSAQIKLIEQQTLTTAQTNKLIKAQTIKTTAEGITSAKQAETASGLSPIIRDAMSTLNLMLKEAQKGQLFDVMPDMVRMPIDTLKERARRGPKNERNYNSKRPKNPPN